MEELALNIGVIIFLFGNSPPGTLENGSIECLQSIIFPIHLRFLFVICDLQTNKFSNSVEWELDWFRVVILNFV